MTRRTALRHEFVEYVPEKLDDGVLYVSLRFATVVHRCCCGCGCEVVTPLSPAAWQATFDGETVSLHPSIGNWGFACQSHYWIRNDRVRWTSRWSEGRIAAARDVDRELAEEHMASRETAPDQEANRPAPEPLPRSNDPVPGLVRRMLRRWFT